MILNAPNLARPLSSLDGILENLFHDFREMFTREFAPYPIELSFKVKIPVKVREKLKEYIPREFRRYGFEVLNIKDTENGIIIEFK